MPELVTDGDRMEGKIVLITGASRGIGREIAKAFARQGATVVLAARSASSGDGPFAGGILDAVDEIRSFGGIAHGFLADLSNVDERATLVQRVLDEVGPVSVLVNNAAVTYFGPVVGFASRRFDLMLEVQVRAPFHLSQLVAEQMAERGEGWILNISSIVSRHPDVPPTTSWHEGVGGTVYGMCKAALERFSSGLAAELFGAGVAVNALSPNRVVPTPGTIFHGLTSETSPEAERPGVLARAALELCTGDPQVQTGRVVCSQDLLDELFRSKSETAFGLERADG